jgi:hypothetical protein
MIRNTEDGKRITPGLYQTTDDDRYLRIFRQGETLYCQFYGSPKNMCFELNLEFPTCLPLSIKRVDPKKVLGKLEKQITWILEHFPDSTQNPPNFQPSKS